jgi:flagellar biosynthetic protein FlhB
MAEGDRDAADRTEAATPRRLQKAREAGHVPVSRELSSFAVLAGACLVLAMVAPASARSLVARLAVLLEQAHAIDPRSALGTVMREAAVAAAPFALAAMVAGAGSVLLQTRFLINPAALTPDLARLSPWVGVRRVFGTTTLVESGKAALKAAVAGLTMVVVLKGAWAELSVAVFWTAPDLMAHTSALLLRMALAVVAVQGAVALLDFVRAFARHARELRMSREDLREELRESEGDPLIRGRLRQLRLKRARTRMMAQVGKATVVVTNPTHYAVALSYHRGAAGAPRVVAKGADEVAARIRAVAEEHRIPLISNPPLARALYRVELEAEIPPELFQAVAALIAYVWRLHERARPRRPVA